MKSSPKKNVNLLMRLLYVRLELSDIPPTSVGFLLKYRIVSSELFAILLLLCVSMLFFGFSFYLFFNTLPVRQYNGMRYEQLRVGDAGVSQSNVIRFTR